MLFDCWLHHHEYITALFKKKRLGTFNGDKLHIPCLKKKPLTLAVFSDTIKARYFKVCMIITLLGSTLSFVALMTLTLFQGHRCVRNINCKLGVLDFCPLVWCCMVATHIKKIMHNMICMTDVYSREIINMFFINDLACWKLKHSDLLKHHKYDTCEAFHASTTHWTVSVHTTFSDLYDISRSQYNSFNWKLCVLIQLRWNFVGKVK